jgi:hypothetical protein
MNEDEPLPEAFHKKRRSERFSSCTNFHASRGFIFGILTSASSVCILYLLFYIVVFSISMRCGA